MKSAKGHHHQQEDEEEEDEEFGTKRDAAPSNNNPSNNNNNAKDGKNSDKANAIRSKHSVTEQRRRSKINERFQILRDLIPHSDQKRDTASFLLEVIQYVQYLQEKVQKYEGSYQAWSSEPTKLMPWRNSHWRIQSLVGHPQAMKNGSAQGPIFPGRFDDNNVTVSSSLQSAQPNPLESNGGRENPGKAMDQAELVNKSMAMPMPMPMPMPQTSMPVPVQNDGAFSFTLPRPASDSQSTGCPNPTDALNQQEELTVEGGTISISSVYSQGLLDSLSQALQTAGVDLSQATISVQINLGKQPNKGVASGILAPKDPENPIPSVNQPMEHFQDSSNGEDLDQAHKRLKV